MPPGPRAPDAKPPTIGRPGWALASSASRSGAGTLNGSPISSMAWGVKGTDWTTPSKVTPPGSGRAVMRTGTTGPNRPAHRLIAGPPSISRPVPTMDSDAAPITTEGWSTSRTVATTSSRAPAWARVTKASTRSGWDPSASSSWPHASPVAKAGTGCSERAAAKGTGQPVGGSKVRGTMTGSPLLVRQWASIVPGAA